MKAFQFHRRVLCTSLLILAIDSYAQTSGKVPSTKADVVETKVVHPCYQTGNSVSCLTALDIKAVIDGRTFWLEAAKPKYDLKDGLLELGTYKVRLLDDEHPIDSKFKRSYTFIYPNGKTEDYFVIGESK